MAKKKKKQIKKTKHYVRTIVMLIFVLALSYFIFSHDLLKPQLNELTTSYISFNNSYSTDMLKINNLKKMKDSQGTSSKNRQKIDLKITGSAESEYKLIVYPINSEVDLKYVKFSISDGNNSFNNNLSEMPSSKDGGKIIYTNNIKNSSITLNMWISTDYKDKVNDNSYEIKIMEKV